MTEQINDIYARFDSQEELCRRAQEKFDAARTPIGRFFANLRLNGLRDELEQITDEHDIVTLYGVGQPAAPESPEL